MPKPVKHSKRPTDPNLAAHLLVEQSTQDPEAPQAITLSEYMASIGRKGGKIGGKRRLKTMSAEQRKKVAQKAAKARWNTKKH